MENWPDLYVEISEKLTSNISEILWVDLWHNQVNFLTSEHSFRTPAVFLRFRTLGTEDLGDKQQKVNLQIDFYLYYETFLDTFQGAYNQSGALEFLKTMEKIHGVFHGTAGDNYSAMRRVGYNDEETGGSGNLYKITFTCLSIDTSAAKYYEESDPVDFSLSKTNSEDEYIIPG